MPISNPQTLGAVPGLTLKAWALTDGTTLVKGFNVSSVSISSNVVTLNFTNDLGTASYVLRALPQGRVAGNPPGAQNLMDVRGRWSNQVQYALYDNTNTAQQMLHFVEVYA